MFLGVPRVVSKVLVNECTPAWFFHALPMGLLTTTGCCSVTWASPSSQHLSLLTTQPVVLGCIFPYNFLKELKQGCGGWGDGLGSPRVLLSSRAVVSLSLLCHFARNACSDTQVGHPYNVELRVTNEFRSGDGEEAGKASRTNGKDRHKDQARSSMPTQ